MAEEFTLATGSAKIVGIHAGNGPDLVFLHAGVADHRMWRDQIAAFEPDFHVIAYDRREFGRTDSPNETFSQVEDLAAVLNHVGAGTPILIGCSQGGRVAIDFSLANPGRVKALVLVSTAVSGAPSEPPPPGAEALAEALDRAEEDGDLDRVNAIEAHLWLDGPLCDEGRVQGAARDLFLDMNGIALRKLEIPLERAPPSAVEQLDKLTMPTLIIGGGQDFPYNQARCAELSQTLPDARVILMPGAAHLPNLEQPGLFNGHVQEFLRGFRT